MHHHQMTDGQATGLATPVRNHYFYGQLLGVHNFELETDYGIGQRRLLNRLVLGYGVVCGMAVDVSRDGTKVAVGPGLALDRWGAEIVVDRRSGWIAIPPDVIDEARERAHDHDHDQDHDDGPCVQVVICYHECRGDPEPARVGDCNSPDPCVPSTIREQYRLEFRSRCAKRPDPSCDVPDLLTQGGFDHEQLARWVTHQRRCTRLPADPCIPLANLRVEDDDDHHRCRPNEVDIGVRPIVASNVVLMQLVLALLERGQRDYQYE